MARLLDDLWSHPVGRPLHALVSRVCRAQHQPGLQSCAARFHTWLLIKLKPKGVLFACFRQSKARCILLGMLLILLVGKSQAFSNKLHPVRHAADLLVMRFWLFPEPRLDHRSEAAASTAAAKASLHQFVWEICDIMVWGSVCFIICRAFP